VSYPDPHKTLIREKGQSAFAPDNSEIQISLCSFPFFLPSNVLTLCHCPQFAILHFWLRYAKLICNLKKSQEEEK
jgi:hypothetical protein